jgi:Dolichyl-phosphate-mannose-protein mannosyltransferase
MTASPWLADVSLRERRISKALWMLGGVLAACAVIFVLMTRHWPMVGDAALLHYYVFLIGHGWAPYRDFADVNMPGAYWASELAMLLPVQPDTAWRLFDLALVALAGVGYYSIARPYSRFAALFATVLLLLVHGQDGVQQAGQRDLAIGTLLILAFAFLMEALRQNRWGYLIPFGLGVGLAATIKPTADPLGMLLLAMVVIYRERAQKVNRSVSLVWLAAGMATMAIPLGAMLLWLEHQGSLRAWMATEQLILPYYATTDRRPIGFTFSHSISPLAALVVLWLLCLALRGPRWPNFERLLAATGVVVNLLGLLAQGKALPYQRYPMLVFLLLLIALDLTTAWHRQDGTRRVARYAALAGLCCGCLVIAPLALARVHRFVGKRQQFDTVLAADLGRINDGNVSGRVQCLDTIQDCLPTLDAMRLLPATAIPADQPLFDPRRMPAVEILRRRFERAVTRRPPMVFVMVSGYFLDSGSGYRKLETWPAFKQWLEANYTLAVERPSAGEVRWWSRAQAEPGYRLYVLNGTPTQLNAGSH